MTNSIYNTSFFVHFFNQNQPERAGQIRPDHPWSGHPMQPHFPRKCASKYIYVYFTKKKTEIYCNRTPICAF